MGGSRFFAVTGPFIGPVRLFKARTAPFLWPVRSFWLILKTGHRPVRWTVWGPFVLLNERSQAVQRTAIDQSLNCSMTIQTIPWPFLYIETVRWPVKPLEDRSFWIRSVRLRLGPFRSIDRSVHFGSEPVRSLTGLVRSDTLLFARRPKTAHT